MKSMKLIALSAVFASALFAADGLSFTQSVGFQSEYLWNGLSLADSTLVASLKAEYSLYNGTVYGLIKYQNPNDYKWFRYGNCGSYSESNISVGYKTPVYGNFSVDAGLTYNWYPSNSFAPIPDVYSWGNQHDNTKAIYAGVTYSGLYVDPTLYVTYDMDLQSWKWEISGSHSYDLAQYGVANTTLDLGFHYGYIWSDDLLGWDTASSWVDSSDSWAFYGVDSNLVYAISDTASVSVGVSYAGNNENGDFADGYWGFGDNINAPDSSLFWNAKLTFKF